MSSCSTPQRALTDEVFPKPLVTCAAENSMRVEAVEFRRSPRKYSGQCLIVRGYEVPGLFFEDHNAWDLFRRTGSAAIGAYGLRGRSVDATEANQVELVALAFMCSEYNRRQARAERREQDVLSRNLWSRTRFRRCFLTLTIRFVLMGMIGSHHSMFSKDVRSRIDHGPRKSCHFAAEARNSACHLARISARGTSSPRI